MILKILKMYVTAIKNIDRTRNINNINTENRHVNNVNKETRNINNNVDNTSKI